MPPRSSARRVLRPLPTPRNRRGEAMAERHSAIDTTTPPCERRHGSAGAPRALGAGGPCRGPITCDGYRGAPRLGRGATSAGGVGGPSRGPITCDGYRGAPRLCRDATSAGGVGGPSRGPITCDGYRGAPRLCRDATSAGGVGGPSRGPPSTLTPQRRHAKTAPIRRPSGAGERQPMTPSSRVRFEPVEGADRLFTPAFNEFLAALHDRLHARALKLRADRARLLADAHAGRRPAPLPPSEATTGNWKVSPVPDELKKPGIEISGPCSITSMFINALNPGPEGERAEGDLDDDEDSGGHRLIDTVRAAANRLAAVNRELYFNDTERKREYKIAPGELPFFMHRERGLHLDEPDARVDGRPVNAAVLGTALTLFYAGRAQANRGQGIYFYLPKLESADEARFYRELFDACRERLPA